MSGGWKGGGSRAWRRVKAAVLLTNRLRNGGTCQVRVDAVCTGVAQTAHHVLGRAVTGDDPDHLAASCHACNLHIGEPARHDPTCPLCARSAINARRDDPPHRAVTNW